MNNISVAKDMPYKLVFISLFLFLFARGTDYDNILQLGSIFFFCLFVIVRNHISFPRWKEFRIAIFIVFIYSIPRIGAEAWLQDIKNYIFLIYGVILFYNLIKYLNVEKFISTITVLNIIIFISFIVFSLKIVHNIYMPEGGIAEYKNFRVPGPTLVMFYALPFYRLLTGFRKGKYIYINMVLGIVSAVISGGLQNLLIMIIVYVIYFININAGYIVKITIGAVIFILLVTSFVVGYLSKSYVEKFSSIANPFEAQTVQTRMEDLNYMLKNDEPQNKIVGDGIGVSSTVYRINPFNVKLSGYGTFLEIDNGFYYVFHRFGLIGLLGFLGFHFMALKRTESLKFKLCYWAFFIITNLLSIHYFTSPATSFFIVLLFLNSYRRKVLFKPTIK